jgi:glycopeptide antibiotics resistance protein
MLYTAVDSMPVEAPLVLALGAIAVVVALVVGLVTGRGVRVALWFALAFSLAIIGVLTLGSALNSGFTAARGVNLEPFTEIDRGFNNRGTDSWRNVVGNVALFVPLGFAIACLARGGFWARATLATATGLVLSTAIEIAQYSLGRVADIDDIILNTTGALAGGVLGAAIAVTVVRARRAREPASDVT